MATLITLSHVAFPLIFAMSVMFICVVATSRQARSITAAWRRRQNEFPEVVPGQIIAESQGVLLHIVAGWALFACIDSLQGFWWSDAYGPRGNTATQYRVIAASFNLCQSCVILVSSADVNGSTIALDPLDVMGALNTPFVAVFTLLTRY